MGLEISATICIFWYLVLLGYFSLCAWRKLRFSSRPILLSPWVFIPIVSGISAVIGSLVDPFLIPLAVEFAIGLVISFVHPIFAASFFLVTFLLKPWELLPKSEIMEILPRSLAALAFASLFFHFTKLRSTRIVFNFGVLLFFCFMGWILLSGLVADNRQDQVDAFITAMLPVIATFLLIINASKEPLDLEVIRGGLVIAVLALTSVGIAETLTIWNFDFSIPIPRMESKGQWANANDLSALMVLALPLAFFPLIVRSRSWLNRSIGVLVIVFLLTGIWMSQSRGAILAIVTAMLAYLLTSFKLKPKLLVPFAILLIVPVALFSTIQRDSSDISGSNSMRLEYMLTGFRMLKTNPITGVGFENYSKLYERFTTRFDEYGERTAHSSWVLAMAETGLPGLALFAGLFFYALWRAYLLREICPELLVALVGYGVCMSLLSHTYQLAPYVLYALITSAKRLLLPKVELPLRQAKV